MNRLVFLFLVGLLVFSFVSVVSASYVCPVQQAVTSANYESLAALHPAASAYRSAAGSAFTANSSAYLYEAQFWLSRYNNPLGELTCRIYAVSGVLGDDAVPTGDALASSDSVEMSSISGTASYVAFTFDGLFLIENGESYVVVVEVSEGTGVDATNTIRSYRSSSDVDVGLNRVIFTGSNWVAYDTDCVFVVNGDTVSSAPTPTPSPSPSSTPLVTAVPEYPMPDPFVSVPSYYMVLLVLFAVVAVLAGLYVTFEREQSNKGVALLFVLVGLVVFVVLIVGYFVGF